MSEPVQENPTASPVTPSADTQPTAALAAVDSPDQPTETAPKPVDGSTKATAGDTKSILTVHHLNNSRSQRVLWLLVRPLRRSLS